MENCAGDRSEDTLLVKMLPSGTPLFTSTINPPVEGDTVYLSGDYIDDSNDPIASLAWRQVSGPNVYLSGANTQQPWFVTPPSGISGQTAVFELTLVYQSGFTTTLSVPVSYADNGITGFDDDVLTFYSTTGNPLGIIVEGGQLAKLTPVDPATITDTENRPENLIYGLTGLEIVPETTGGEVRVTFILPDSLPGDYSWFKHHAGNGWFDFTANVTFNADRTRVTLILTDGGAGDADNTADGVIRDPSGPGTLYKTPEGPDETVPVSTGGGGGGCFLRTSAGLK